MNYIENKTSFKEKYSAIEIDDIINNFVTKNYILLDYTNYLENMTYLSKEKIIELCQEFLKTLDEKLFLDFMKIVSNIKFIKEENNLSEDGKIFYENGIIKCTINLRNNLYDLFILVHEITHYLTMINPRKEEYKDEYLLFSEVFPFRIEEELIKYLSNNQIYNNDLKKCIKAREIVLKNIIKKVSDSKDNLVENIDFEFRYIISIIYKNKIKTKLSEGIYDIGILNIKDIIDFSI